MNKEIKIEKTIKLVESITDERLEPWQRELLRSRLSEIEMNDAFSDDEPANSPRPVENSPLNAQKKPGFGPEQTR